MIRCVPPTRWALRLLAIGSFAGLVGGCVLLPRLPPPALPLLTPASLGQARASDQVLEFAYGEREVSLQCAVDVTPQQLSLVAVGPLGQRAFTLKYDGQAVQADLSPYVPSDLPPERVLADLQLALWPLAAWKRALVDQPDWQLSEPRPGLRRLRYRERLVEEVRYADAASAADPWSGHLSLVNTALGYILDIEAQKP